MDIIAVDCSWADAQLRQTPELALHLPPELRTQILEATGNQYLEALASSAKLSQLTDCLFPLYEPIFVDLAARWTTDVSAQLADTLAALSSLAKVLPFAPHLTPYVHDLIESSSLQTLLSAPYRPDQPSLNEDQFSTLLTAIFRLLSYRRDDFDRRFSPVFFTSLLRHENLPIRYLAVECLCLTMHFAEPFCENLIETYIGTQPVPGTWQGTSIDYRLLKVWEERRWSQLAKGVQDAQTQRQAVHHGLEPKRIDQADLHHRVAAVGGVLLPRMEAKDLPPSSFVEVPNAKQNIDALGQALMDRKPVLLAGAAGSGKTSLIMEAARLLNKQESMITLHLNEQTDAKSLIGLHTSSATGDSFIWQPGVLTRALQQGRWVLIEDIDRAPAEVLGVLRPIVENDSLFIPNRKQHIKAAEGFRIIGTVRSSTDAPSSIASRHSWLTSRRLWSVVTASGYSDEETGELLRQRYPSLVHINETILDVHKRLCALYRLDPAFKAAQNRLPALRDLLKCCRRIDHRVSVLELKLASDAVPETFQVDVFKDAINCYASHLSDPYLYNKVAESVAQALNVAPQQRDFYLKPSEDLITETNGAINVGRSRLAKISTRRSQSRRRPFANTSASRRGLESVAASISFSEACLLVGETGVGKTSLIQHISSLVGQILTVVNLSQQSEVSDLLGGLKPVTTRSLVLPVVEQFNILFDDTFSASRNEKFQAAVNKAVTKENWIRLLKLWQEALQMAEKALKKALKPALETNGDVPATKRRKLETSKYESLQQRWIDFENSVKQIHSQVERGDKTHTFAFVEGRLVQAVRNGEWLLLDEINLASSDTLDHIVSLLGDVHGQRPSILLAEAGNVEKVVAHPDFKVFAAMNPATDAGKKDLPPALRSRFTELYVQSGDDDVDDLVKIIQSYLGEILQSDRRAALDLARTYQEVQELKRQHRLTDGAGDAPHFSIRSLVRCLLYVIQHSRSHGLRRSMYEGFAMSFFTALSRESESLTLPVVEKHLLSSVKNVKSFLAQQPKLAHAEGDFVAFRHHLINKGSMTPDLQPHYIRTASVERNLMNLARAASMRRFPILLQGPTSAGKTSMVEYLAKLSGNKFVRINNHEHTDLQEYLGSYASDTDGKLRFKEGVLVDALRRGHWIVLDELNLAPSDVLEAMNRLLDDNRELLIPETQETVRPHPNFMLFATQNPAGLYGGRKRLSRAFRNRFLEIHFDDIPEDELEVILRERAEIPPSFCAQIVAVYKKLSLQRQSSRLFEQRNSFATLRDLFRWASRPVDDRQQLAQHGFMLLGERVREPSERDMVKTTIEETMKIKIDETALYGEGVLPPKVRSHPGIVWTMAMRRLFVLVSASIKNKEPVLLVGETGCGKTQICQVIAAAFGSPLNIYNAHTNTETGDLIGSQRPVRSRIQLAEDVIESVTPIMATQLNGATPAALDADEIIARFSQFDASSTDPELLAKARYSIGAYQALFAWSDGNLVRSMKLGEHFLLDEISLADDSVLERLNSVLEPARTIVLAEKGSTDNVVIAHQDFQFLATMNPGGDYGKRELSAALRNRMTEIWVPPLSKEDDVLPIVKATLGSKHQHLAPLMLKFTVWFKSTFQNTGSTTIPLRDLLTWAKFVNAVTELSPEEALVHGAGLVFVDSIGANPAGMTAPTTSDVTVARNKCIEFLQTVVGSKDVMHLYNSKPELSATENHISVGSFKMQRVSAAESHSPDLVFDAPTTLKNTMRIVRALQLDRPILLEGNPGVGKTAIVTALAQAVGKPFTRINLSDQTDLMDLFGADSPSDNESLGRFSWRDGPLLQAMQTGGWVLLDEMNLASQSVLEGLNSCLDHRKEAYIAELDKTFTCHPEFKLFAAQNPHHQGGGRKGLPASFVNRFTVVYADPFEEADLLAICRVKYPQVDEAQLTTIVRTVAATDDLMQQTPAYHQGGPWEVNLRDVSRWLELCQERPRLNPMYHFDTIVRHRFRNAAQDAPVDMLRQQHIGNTPPVSAYSRLTNEAYRIGTSTLVRSGHEQQVSTQFSVSPRQLPYAKAIITAVECGWPVVVVGPADSGKTELIRSLAAMSGNELVEISMNGDVDTMDLLGGFEQYDATRVIEAIRKDLATALSQTFQQGLTEPNSGVPMAGILYAWQLCQSQSLDPSALLSSLSTLSELRALAELTQKLRAILKAGTDTRSHFVWNDGVLINAIQSGSWVVLDNANLCNASVLDRLNSLLEPNGQLSVSEQHSSDGTVRTVIPHPMFRIFLTMDPRNGELSRAMRNRSLEVFLARGPEPLDLPRAVTYPCASKMTRLREVLERQTSDSVVPYVDNLSFDDARLIAVLNGQDMAGSAYPDLEPAVQLAMLPSPASRFIQKRLHADVKHTSQVSPNLADYPQLSLLNEPIFTESLQNFGVGAFQYAFRMWQLQKKLAELSVRLDEASKRAASSNVSNLSMLERSALSIQKRSKHNAMLPAVFPFAKKVIDRLYHYVNSIAETDGAIPDTCVATSIAYFVLDLMLLAGGMSPDPARLQVYLKIGAKLTYEHSSELDRHFQDELQVFNAISLNYGRSLQIMWQTWKPQTPQNLTQLKVRLDLEGLLRRLDVAMETLPRSRHEMGPVKKRLLEAMNSAWRAPDAEQVVIALTRSIEGLERQSSRGEATPVYFADVFQRLLDRLRLTREAGHTTVTALLPFTQSQKGVPVGLVHDQAVPNALIQLATLRGSFDERGDAMATELVKSLAGLTHQPLRALDHVEEELRRVATTIAARSQLLSKTMLKEVVASGVLILSAILIDHRHLLSPKATACMELGGVAGLGRLAELPPGEVFQSTDGGEFLLLAYVHQLQPAMTLLSSEDNKPRSVGEALIHTAVAALTLMVPDKPFDPALLPQVEAERHEVRRGELHAALDAQKQFNRRVAGKESSLVTRLLEQDLHELGQAPAVTLVARPEVSSLTRLQEEFTLIINTVLGGDAVGTLLSSAAHSGDKIDAQAARLCAAIDRIVERLGQVDRAYDDIIAPVVHLLQTLALGVELLVGDNQPNEKGKGAANALQHAPFLGAQPQGITRWPLQSLRKSEHERLQWLQHYCLCQTLRGQTSSASSHGQITDYLNVLDSFYVQWKERLSKDQAEAEAKSRYYAYRGDEDEDPETEQREMAELFPVFDDAGDEDSMSEQKVDQKTVAMRLGQIHNSLFSGGHSHTVKLRDYVLMVMEDLSRQSHPGQQVPLVAILPGLLLQMEDKMHSLRETDRSKPFNIYTDANTQEIRSLQQLVQAIEGRFWEIADRWPEHAVPVDVLSVCKELMNFKIDEPLAKLLTKTEKLLEIVAQWQSVASREWSVAGLMDEITALIISWRRLELSSWSALLDLEKRKSDESAGSWFFIAYEAVVYNSRAIIETDGDVATYCFELAKTLEDFLKNATLGQYVPRLTLLRGLAASLQQLCLDDDGLEPISTCVANVVSHYGRYGGKITKTLQTGRSEFEKAITEQIKLASWKDTNVTALKDSARRSHHKLFKVIKKYRALLGQPINNLASEESKPNPRVQQNRLLEPQEREIDAALQLCSESIFGWNSRPERLRNPKTAVAGMRRIYTAQQGAFDVGNELMTFRDDLEQSIQELRKETPASLNEDNTALVKHLRERKRRLLADTIKDVAKMGIRRNLATVELEKQASLASVLRGMTVLRGTDGQHVVADGAVHDFLDAMPAARNALIEHSSDLTDGEVQRVVGLLEGMLLQILKQREELLKRAAELGRLKDVQMQLLNLCLRGPDSDLVISRIQKSGDDGLHARLDWLPQLLKAAEQVLQFQASLGGLEVNELVHVVQAAAEEIRGLKSQIGHLSTYPAGLTDSLANNLRRETWGTLRRLGDRLRDWQEAEPNIAFLTQQLLPWTHEEDIMANGTVTNGINYLSFSSIDQSMREVIDVAFVALQQLASVKTKAIADAEDTGWLVRNDRHFIESSRALHLSDVSSKLAAVLSSLQYLQAENLPLATSLLAVWSPILEQFYLIAQCAVDKQAAVHAETARLACFLAKSFGVLASEGFCTPAEPSDGQEQSGKLESGTGLGEGEGAEDISKDVGDDEDLTELAQQGGDQQDKDGEEMEEAEGAVDMGADDLEGQTGDAGEKKDDEGDESGSEGEEGEMDEETGSVDELDPNAVDEKMWDEAQKEGEKEDKELKGEKQQGEKTQEQTEAGAEQAEGENEGEVDDGEAGEEMEQDEDDQARDGKAEAEHVDPHLQEEKALELPEDMQLNGEDEEGKSDGDDDGMDELSDIEQPPDGVDAVDEADREETKPADEQNPDGSEDDGDDADAEGKAQDDEIMDDQQLDDAENEDPEHEQRDGDMQLDSDEQAGGEKGATDQVQDDVDPEQSNEGQNQVDQAQHDDDKQPQGQSSADNDDQGETGKGRVERGQGRDSNMQRQQKEAIRKLADVLEQWHQRREIFNPAEERQEEDKTAQQDIDMKEADFEHLDDEEDEGDAQALGVADAGQTQNVDMSKAIQQDDNDDAPLEEDMAMPDVEEPDNEQEQAAERLHRLQASANANTERREDGAFVPEPQQSAAEHDLQDDTIDDTDSAISDTAAEVQQLALSTAPPSPPQGTSTGTATQLWHHCSTATHQSALILTEQLRLILHPTTATKLRGDFRSGKRLNLKRIIPYIASGYRRDKIWLRRSVPSKRNYQVLLAVDDSRSMAEGSNTNNGGVGTGADVLALQTVALLCQSLAMLEVGDVCVLGFGDAPNVTVAQPFGAPGGWTGAEAGVRVFEKLAFRQTGTDVRRLLVQSLEILSEAREKNQRGNEELWQLQIIVSDGHCGQHEEIRRLVRKMREERVMVVFVILDGMAGGDRGQEGQDQGQEAGTGGESILDLKEAVFEEGPDGQMKVVTRRYLERFPFEHYLVVRDVRELPGVLGRCLRGWFAEVEGR